MPTRIMNRTPRAPRVLRFRSGRSAAIRPDGTAWAAALLLLPALACAQSSALPEGVAPGQLEKRFEAPPTPRAAPVLIPESQAPLAPEEASRIRFQLNEVSLDSVTAFPPDALRPLYAQLLGREVSLTELYQLAARLTAHYGSAGYLLARAIVPPQAIEDGRVRLMVVEGYVDQVILEGAVNERPEVFRHYVERIKASRPLHVSVLERYLLLANDLPGMRVQSVLRPSADASGAATLILSVSHSRWFGAVSADNRGSETVGPWQMLFEAGANGLVGRLGSTTVRFATVPDSPAELRYLQLGHVHVVGNEGTRLEFSAVASRSEPGGRALRQLETETRSQAFGLVLSHPIIRARSRNLSVNGGLTLRESDTRLLGQSSAEDRLSVLRLGAVFDHADAWGGTNLVALTVARGLQAFGAKVGSRAHAAPEFTKLELYASRLQALAERWNATVRLSGQLADGSLPASEQFGLGGSGRGRAYEPSEWTGDRALAADLELAYALPGSWAGNSQLYGYYDRGSVWRARPEGQARQTLASSAGVGARTALPGNLTLNVEAAKPFDRHADGRDPDWRFYLNAVWRF